MVSPRLRSLVCCPDCRHRLHDEGQRLVCPQCRRAVDAGGPYLDLRPAAQFAEVTRYTDAALHADARHERVSPPLLGAGVRQAMLRRFLALGAADRVLDLGCGSGRMLVWNADTGAWMIGVDVSPYFAHEALAAHDLLLADLRRLPLPDASIDKAWTLDVLEHLSEEALGEMLEETRRVLVDGGSLFVYSHVRRNARIAGGLRAINRLARALERRGLIDLRQERLRKSDHVNPLADVPHLERVVASHGFRIARIRYYTPIVGGFIENILVRLAEGWLAHRARRRARRRGDAPLGEEAAIREVRGTAKARLAPGTPAHGVLRMLTWLMHVDLLLFGRIESGPFFALLVKEPAGPAHAGPDARPA